MHRLSLAPVILTLLLSSTTFAGHGGDEMGCACGQHVGASPCGAADCLNSGCGACVAPRWIGTADALFLHRSDPDSGILAFNTANPNQNLNAGDFDFGTEAGVDVSLARVFASGNLLELRYFGIDGWDATQVVATTPDDLLRFNSAPPTFAFAGDAIAARYASELHNAEVNVGHRFSDWLGLTAGFRYVELDERGLSGLVGAAIPYNYAVTTENRLYGGQLGAQMLLWCGECLSVSVDGKAGVYGNNAEQAAVASTNVARLLAAGQDDRTAFVGELGIVGVAQLTDCLAIRGGYRLLWLDGVALASDQLAVTNFDTGTGFDGSGDLFYHGALIGLELTY
jgi:hypothetical protein